MLINVEKEYKENGGIRVAKSKVRSAKPGMRGCLPTAKIMKKLLLGTISTKKIIIFAFGMDKGFESGYARFADTGQWKLVVSMSETSICALFKNLMMAEDKPLLLFRKSWEKDPTSLLANIETAIYDHPKILDDFSTHIILETPRVLWIPASMTDEEEFNPEYFTCIYPSEPDDISFEQSGSEAALFSLAPGLNSFLRRTLPGCKVSAGLCILKEHFSQKETERLSKLSGRGFHNGLYLNIRENLVDIFAFSRGKFLSGATQRWTETSDIAYHLLLICKAYGLDYRDVAISAMGTADQIAELNGILKQVGVKSSHISMPAFAEEYDISVPTALTI